MNDSRGDTRRALIGSNAGNCVALMDTQIRSNVTMWELCPIPGLGSNPGEDMDVCKCIVPLRQGGTLNSRLAASPLVWLVEERWEAPDPPSKLGWNRAKTSCMVLKAKDSPQPR
ncbi:hypothetical protein TNCV_3939841 [Trichonephila clavipes]|uniref:Uncharacterized protein n=1 Tax=Trichonephila clavipes TaxID=2585209 RepID=A0A8X6VVH2_TRICX|nr:hypothetical protein TNCV_3939841 [Trichonephila clavipes]